MKNTFKRILLLMGVMILTVTMGACGKKEEPTQPEPDTDVSQETPDVDVEEPEADAEDVNLRLSWWGGDSRHEATQNAIKAYEDQNPHVSIEAEYGAWSGWEEKMALQFSQGNAADVAQVNWNWLEAYSADGNTFYDLNQVSDILDLSQYDQSALDLCTIDGKLQAVPISMTGRLYYWNKTTWEKAGLDLPKTWDDFVNAGEVFKNELGEEYYPFYLTEYDRMIFMVHWLQSKYGRNWVEDGEMQYSAEEIEEGFAMIKELEDKHVIPTLREVAELGVDAIEQSDRWIDGYYGGIHTWDTASGKLKDAIEESTNVPNQEFVVGDFLTGIGDYNGGFTKISMALGMSADTENPEEAAKLMQFLLAEEDGVVAMGDARGVPVNKAGVKIAEDKGFVEPMVLEASLAVMGYNAFDLDPLFEDGRLRSDPEGVYHVVFENHSYGNYDNATATEELIAGINSVLGN